MIAYQYNRKLLFVHLLVQQYLIENARQADGKVYELPVNTKEVRTSSKQIFIRKDIYEENDIPVPVTYEDLYTAAKRLKESYPESWSIQVYYGNGNLLDIMVPSFGTSGGWYQSFSLRGGAG